MTSKESDSLNLRNFLPLPTKGKTPRLPVLPIFVASKAHSKDRHPLLTLGKATNCFRFHSTTCLKQSLPTDASRTTCKKKKTPSLCEANVSQDMFAIGHKDGACFTRPFLWYNKKVLLKGSNINTRIVQLSTSGLKGFSTVPLHGKVFSSAKKKVLILKTKKASVPMVRRRTAYEMGSAVGVEHITRASFGTKNGEKLRPLRAEQVRESFALLRTRNDLSEKKNSVLCAYGNTSKQQVLDNVKTKHVLKPFSSCWVKNRNNNGKPFNSALGKQSSFSPEKDQRSRSQFQKNTNSSNKLLTNRTQIKTPIPFDKAKTGVIYLTYTSNNTVCTLVDFKGVTKGWSSCGSLGFKSARKSTAYASQATTERIGLKAKEVGFKWVFLVLKGVGRGKESGVRALRKSGIEILGILEKTGIPHNGCRAPRKRRI